MINRVAVLAGSLPQFIEWKNKTEIWMPCFVINGLCSQGLNFLA